MTKWRKLIADLKYKDWVMDSPGWWWCPSFHPEIAIKKVRNMVKIYNGGSFPIQSDKHGYLDEVVVYPEHVKTILELIYEAKES